MQAAFASAALGASGTGRSTPQAMSMSKKSDFGLLGRSFGPERGKQQIYGAV